MSRSSDSFDSTSSRSPSYDLHGYDPEDVAIMADIFQAIGIMDLEGKPKMEEDFLKESLPSHEIEKKEVANTPHKKLDVGTVFKKLALKTGRAIGGLGTAITVPVWCLTGGLGFVLGTIPGKTPKEKWDMGVSGAEKGMAIGSLGFFVLWTACSNALDKLKDQRLKLG